MKILVLCIAWLFIFSSCSSKRRNTEQLKNNSQPEAKFVLTHPVWLIDSAGVQRLIHERNGKILLLNIWATWCLPCIEEFPDLIKLAREDTALEVVGISIDYPDEIDSKVVPFLAKLKVPFRVCVAKYAKQENFISTLDTNWNGAIPATYIYDLKGKQIFSAIGEQTYEQFKKIVNLSREKKPS